MFDKQLLRDIAVEQKSLLMAEGGGTPRSQYAELTAQLPIPHAIII